MSSNTFALAATGTRWAARALGTFLLLLVLVFTIGEGPPTLSSVRSASFNEALAMLAFLLMLTGLALLWKREGPGGALTLAGFLVFLAISGFRVGPVFLLFPVAGVLGVLAWWSGRLATPEAKRRLP
jgi:hypothetical protein